MRFISHLRWGKTVTGVTLSFVVLLLLGFSPSLLAATTNAAPVTPAPAGGSFGQYLVDHQDDLAPFFDAHRDEMIKEGLPLLFKTLATILLLNLVIGWAFDVGLSFGFSKLFAPGYAKLKQALIYASGRLVIGFVLILLIMLSGFGSNMLNSVLVVILLVPLLGLANLAAQVFWVSSNYRTTVGVSILFYIALVFIHGVLGGLVSGPIIKAQVAAMMTQFIDKNVTGQLQTASAGVKHDLAQAEQSRDKVKADVAAAQARLDQAKTEQDQLRQAIEAKKNSDTFVYGRIVRIHAQGDLLAARDQFTDFLKKFPTSPLNAAASAQLAQVNSELAVQDAQKKQADADAAQAAAVARADLLARAGKGDVTLSEIRQVLIGKSREDVKDLFGEPTDTASDRWGYGQKMIVNPMTNELFGLTIYFAEGKVQGVDYYYGIPTTK